MKTFIKQVISTFLIFTLVLWLAIPSAYADEKVHFYDCTGKKDGNYTHPFDCTRFISCIAGAYAYERDCPVCPSDPTNCPKGRLHYQASTDSCELDSVAGCVTDPESRIKSFLNDSTASVASCSIFVAGERW
ncbi:carbohydrate-binding module family 14 protein [Nostoc sp.]